MEHRISYEIERYEVRLSSKSWTESDTIHNFYDEETAVCFARTYEQDHPGRKAEIYRVEKAVLWEE